MDQRTMIDEAVSREMDAVMPQVAALVAESLGVDHCAIFAYSEDQQSTIAQFRYGYDDTGATAHRRGELLPPRGAPIEAHVLQTRQPFVRATKADFARFPLTNPGQEEIEGRLTDLVVPLLWDDDVQGIAYLWRTNDPGPFSADRVQAAMDAGQLAAMTMVFTRQYSLERKQRQRLDTLLNVASISVSGRGLDDVLQALAQSVRAATGADVCSLYVFDQNGIEVLAAFQVGLQPDDHDFFVSSQLVSSQDAPAEVRVRRTLEPIIIRDYAADLSTDSLLAKFAVERGISELLLTPIAWQSELIGVMYCWYWSVDQRFTQVAIETAEAIARQAGGVVSRARLEESAQRQTVESEALLRIGRAVMATDSLEVVLDEIAGALEQLVSFDYAYVGMLTANREHIQVVREWGVDHTPILNSLIPVEASLSGYAITSGMLVSSNRLIEDPRAWKCVPAGRKLHAVSVAPLKSSHRTLGVLFVARESERKFSPREERLIALLSQQAALAIERVQSREELTRRADRQAYLARAGELLVAGDNPETVCSQIARLSAGVLADGIAIGLSGWRFGEIHWVADAFDDPKLKEIFHRGLQALEMDTIRERLEEVLVLNQELICSTSSIWPEHQFLRSFTDQLGVNSILAIPLLHQERALGLMVLFSRADSTLFPEEDLEIARIVAQRLGDALERHQVRRDQESLLRISEALHGQDDLSVLINTIAMELEQILPCDELIVADYDGTRNLLHTQVYRQHGDDVHRQESLPTDRGICGEALRTQLAIMDNEADRRETSYYPTSSKRDYYAQHGESVLATALIAEDEVLGVLFMNRMGRNRFTSAEFETFLLFAGLASAALDRTALQQTYRDLYRASTEVLAAVVDAKDPMTLEHSRHVAFYSRLLGELLELPGDQLERIELAGLLHDIGKLGIPDRVLQKPGRLTDEEFALIKTHPDRGARILAHHPALEDLIPLVLHHHEAQDGRGYPAGLRGEDIPLGAAIICVADAFDTMTSERTYQKRRTVDAALDELKQCAGTQFNPELVQRFIGKINEDRSLVFSVRDTDQ